MELTGTVGGLEQERFWKNYYDNLARRGTAWLDYGNQRVQEQTLALAIDQAEPVAAKSCVDVGCGKGQLALALSERGASEIVGTDASAALLEQLALDAPQIGWINYSLLNPPAPQFFRGFDRVFAVEVLQYVPIGLGLAHLWQLTSPGGRLVGIVPNRDCPFLADAIARFRGYYAPPSASDLETAIAGLDGAAAWKLSGMWYTQQPEGAPYRVADLSGSAADGPPNRFVFVVNRFPSPGFNQR